MDGGSAAVYAGQCLLAASFLTAGVNKLRSVRQFELSLHGIAFVPRRLVPLVAMALPIVEICSGVLLAANIAVRSVAIFLVVLLAAFSLALGDLLRHKVDFQCMCFGAASHQSVTWGTVGRNLVLIGVAGAVGATAPIDIGSTVSSGVLGAVVAVVTGLLALGTFGLVVEGFKASAVLRQLSRLDQQQSARA